MAETIEVAGSDSINNSNWKPYQGEEITSLVKFKGFVDSSGRISDTGERVISETFKILEMCGDPHRSTSSDTGLVIGYVQSGKTLSFTSLTALANDNQYQLIIIIAGMSTLLSEQSYDRIFKDLRVENRFDRKWILIKNPESKAHHDSIESNLNKWRDGTLTAEKCSTVLVTVMKNGNRLSNLTRVLRGLNLLGVATLIIDDESDQASVNTQGKANSKAGVDVNEGLTSTIYKRINELRELLPHHTFLQYTATPQALLFINIMDRLSPNFIKLLTPGIGYTGGKSFFLDNPNLVRAIPINEIASSQNSIIVPPDSFLYALQIFFLGVAEGESRNDERNRTMMIHPSRLTAEHSDFFSWTGSIVNSWIRIFQSQDIDERDELISDFRLAFDDLALTVSDLSDFEGLISGYKLLHALKYTRILLVNATNGRIDEIPWRENYSWILVGGQAMDRGFTVEGLTVTYMPRPLATGQIDTTLQRARFFGYKGSYLGFCRVWLDQANINAYRVIIEHEEDIRTRLEDFSTNNKHLNDWDREVVCDEMLNLTRPNILFNSLDRDYFGREWFIVKAPHDMNSLIPHNRKFIGDFLSIHRLKFSQDSGSDLRTEEQRNLVAEISLGECLNQLLNHLKFTRKRDSETFSSLRALLKHQSHENSEEVVMVFLMSCTMDNKEIRQNIRTRRLSKNGSDTIEQLFQGSNAKTGFPGTRNIKSENRVTLQIYRLHLLSSTGTELFDDQGEPIYDDVPSIAVWIPSEFGTDIIRQPDNR